MQEGRVGPLKVTGSFMVQGHPYPPASKPIFVI